MFVFGFKFKANFLCNLKFQICKNFNAVEIFASSGALPSLNYDDDDNGDGDDNGDVDDVDNGDGDDDDNGDGDGDNDDVDDDDADGKVNDDYSPQPARSRSLPARGSRCSPGRDL